VIISLALGLIGTDDEPRWVTEVRPGGGSSPHWNYCCEDGHWTPEAAAAHGAELGASLLGRDARNQEPGTAGALAIAALEAAA
jgi:hypothetical protein